MYSLGRMASSFPSRVSRPVPRLRLRGRGAGGRACGSYTNSMQNAMRLPMYCCKGVLSGLIHHCRVTQSFANFIAGRTSQTPQHVRWRCVVLRDVREPHTPHTCRAASSIQSCAATPPASPARPRVTGTRPHALKSTLESRRAVRCTRPATYPIYSHYPESCRIPPCAG